MGKKSKRPRPLQRQVGSVVEDAILVAGGPGFSTLQVSLHSKLDASDTEYRAKASLGERTGTVSVGDTSVTQIKPHQPYTACRYGNIVEVKVLDGVEFYWVVWDDGPVSAGRRGERMRCRVVSKRPPWVPEPDRKRWPAEVKEKLSASSLGA